MNITSGQKKLALFGILVIAGGAAFVFFDPLGLDLLGQQKKAPAVAAPKAAPRPAAPAAKSNGPAKSGATAVVATPPASAPAVTQAASAPAATKITEVHQPQAKAEIGKAEPGKTESVSAQPGKTASSKPRKPVKPRDVDLRDCLKLEDNAAIAKCAEE
ncbi:MAG: hypothetical protein HY016_02420 [Nitrosomonadales bacterium]|nr:hypothetical protein [Nitrosomonadales bacterium]